MEIATLISTFLGGGFTVKLIDWYRETRSVTSQREFSYVQEQLKLLYGPLHFWAVQADIVVRQASDVEKAYKAVYEDKKWSEESLRATEKPAKNTIDLMNAYWSQLDEVNVQIAKVLETNWQLIDEDDVEPFGLFLAHQRRHRMEPKAGVSFEISQQLGPILTWTKDFTTRVADKWKGKRDRLQQLMKGSTWFISSIRRWRRSSY